MAGRWRLVAAALAVVNGLTMLPAVRAGGKAVAVLAEAVGASFPRPFAPVVRRGEATLDGVPGTLYVPDRAAPAILLVLGAAPRGPDDPRAVRLSQALARAGRVVFAPRLTLAERRFDGQDLDRIVRGVLALEAHPGTIGPVAMLGISYGGSYALVAAADPRLQGRLATVSVFGAYFDLAGVIQAVTTGRSLVAGRPVPWEGHPLAREVLDRYAVQLAPAGSRDGLEAALAGRAAPDSLDPPGRAVYDLLANRDPSRSEHLVAALPADGQALLSGFSPATVAGRITAPVTAMHSTDDPAVPYGELIRLHRALPRARIITVGSFRHVDPRSAGPGGVLSLATDLWDVWRFAAGVLASQE